MQCKKAFRKDAREMEDADEYCPHCDNHFVSLLLASIVSGWGWFLEPRTQFVWLWEPESVEG